MTKDEALDLALEAMQRYQVKRQDFDRFADEITAIKQARSAPVLEKKSWVGLSHEEVMDSWDEIRDGDWAPDFYAVIEAKLKERNV